AGLPTRTIPLVAPTDIPGAVLDIRQDAEWNAGHLPAAVHVELGRLTEGNVAAGPVTLMCGHGERAMTGASILEAAGHRDLTVLVGGPEDWAAATGEGLHTG